MTIQDGARYNTGCHETRQRERHSLDKTRYTKGQSHLYDKTRRLWQYKTKPDTRQVSVLSLPCAMYDILSYIEARSLPCLSLSCQFVVFLMALHRSVFSSLASTLSSILDFFPNPDPNPNPNPPKMGFSSDFIVSDEGHWMEFNCVICCQLRWNLAV